MLLSRFSLSATLVDDSGRTITRIAGCSMSASGPRVDSYRPIADVGSGAASVPPSASGRAAPAARLAGTANIIDMHISLRAVNVDMVRSSVHSVHRCLQPTVRIESDPLITCPPNVCPLSEADVSPHAIARRYRTSVRSRPARTESGLAASEGFEPSYRLRKTLCRRDHQLTSSEFRLYAMWNGAPQKA